MQGRFFRCGRDPYDVSLLACDVSLDALVTSSVLVTTSMALVTTSDALVTTGETDERSKEGRCSALLEKGPC